VDLLLAKLSCRRGIVFLGKDIATQAKQHNAESNVDHRLFH
jgi:hypothetical protein